MCCEITREQIENQAVNIVNEYIKYWPNGADILKYSLSKLDAMYFYLIDSYENKKIDIFNYRDDIFLTLFMVY